MFRSCLTAAAAVACVIAATPAAAQPIPQDGATPGEIAAWLRTQGLEGVDPDNRADRAALHRCALHLLDLAEDYYRSAAVGVAALDRRPAFAIAAAQAIYREIGVILRRRGPDAWDGRISTTTAGKLRLIAGAAPGTLLALRRPVPRFDRSALFRRPG